ncbi:GNAT family N-acetyltransferase [Subsaxibacter sp. CAU 1640]|uniref:GNAT family N-acetyltransferase n=1 Tax=Subsaxibacter sp. CAU 1640 TaxID=2933271 RepID=UPI002005647A|nr:GNAT family N-acetyltransferase [Subsaxibacter sp. CAU 1640]MCK7590984.1 GNAT family N-acetyltransferase [Subsaxibacter sp. CAU 1640]
METTFSLLNSNDSKQFFDILPKDWQDEIVPFWDNYRVDSKIYVIKEDEQIIGGGVVFSTCPPDVDYYKKEAQQWFDKNFHYLGFIWIDKNKRNRNLGSYWLYELKKAYPNQKYWLLIEEEHLHRFYQKNGFVLDKMIVNNGTPEWLYTFESAQF